MTVWHRKCPRAPMEWWKWLMDVHGKMVSFSLPVLPDIKTDSSDSDEPSPVARPAPPPAARISAPKSGPPKMAPMAPSGGPTTLKVSAPSRPAQPAPRPARAAAPRDDSDSD
eukprot:s51_g2.t1